MKTWMKVAIGCVAAAMIGLFALTAAFVGLGYWAKGRVEEAAGLGPEARQAREELNRIPFARPADGRVSEDRLKLFIDVQAATHVVYDKYKSEFEARMRKLENKEAPGLSDLATGLTFIGEVQRAELEALVRVRMPEGEHAFIEEAVQTFLWSEVAQDVASGEAAKALERSARGNLPPEAKEALARVAEEARAESSGAKRPGTAENAVLFRKYEKELRRFAMPGFDLAVGDRR